METATTPYVAAVQALERRVLALETAVDARQRVLSAAAAAPSATVLQRLSALEARIARLQTPQSRRLIPLIPRFRALQMAFYGSALTPGMRVHLVEANLRGVEATLGCMEKIEALQTYISSPVYLEVTRRAPELVRAGERVLAAQHELELFLCDLERVSAASFELVQLVAAELRKARVQLERSKMTRAS